MPSSYDCLVLNNWREDNCEKRSPIKSVTESISILFIVRERDKCRIHVEHCHCKDYLFPNWYIENNMIAIFKTYHVLQREWL